MLRRDLLGLQFGDELLSKEDTDLTLIRMQQEKANITVYYDGACPKCIRDRSNYEKLSGKSGENVCWVDITGKEEQLLEIGIDPRRALTELHVVVANQKIVSELDAYILLMSKVPVLRPFSWLIGLPLIRPILSKTYHWQVSRRLKRSGRI